MRVFALPWNVGVAATVAPLVPCWIVRLWATEDVFVKAIVTLPALTVNELLVNFSWPVGSAATAAADAIPAPELDGVLAVVAEV